MLDDPTVGLDRVDDGETPQEDGQPRFASRQVDTGASVIDLNEMIRQSKGA